MEIFSNERAKKAKEKSRESHRDQGKPGSKMDDGMGIDEEFFLLRQDLLLPFGETLIEFLDFRFI